MKLNPNSPERYRIEKYFWYGQVPLAIVMFLFDRSQWEKISILYLAILSIWALGSTADGNEEASRAKVALEATEDEATK